MKKILFFAAIFLLTQSAVHADFLEKKQAVLGQKVQDFTLQDWSGNPVSLSQYAGKPVVIYFWSAQCPFVKRYEKRLQAIAEEFAAKDVAVFGIDSNSSETPEQIKKAAQERGVNYPILIDAGNKIADQFGAITTPHVYIMDARGYLVYEGAVDDEGWKEGGPITRAYLRDALNELLAGKPVSASKTKTFGCTIKRAFK